MEDKAYTPGLKAIKDYFEMSMEEMKAEFMPMSAGDKDELGILASEALNAKLGR